MLKREVEEIIKRCFENVPFHNLYFMNDVIPHSTQWGGTCSDIVLGVQKSLADNGIKSHLHSSFINGEETHRLLRIIIDEEEYFADVGNGWPSMKLFSAANETEYSCYGITFRSILEDEFLHISNIRKGVEKRSVSVPLVSKSEQLILRDIERRYVSEIEYPYKNSIRFAQVIDNRFLFLRGDILYIYSTDVEDCEEIDVSEHNLSTVLSSYFRFDLNHFLSKNNR